MIRAPLRFAWSTAAASSCDPRPWPLWWRSMYQHTTDQTFGSSSTGFVNMHQQPLYAPRSQPNSSTRSFHRDGVTGRTFTCEDALCFSTSPSTDPWPNAIDARSPLTQLVRVVQQLVPVAFL